MIIYRVGKYKYDRSKGKIYKKGLLFYWTIKDRVSNWKEGVDLVNRLAGLKLASQPQPTGLTKVEATNDLCGRFRVHFKEPEVYFSNDPLPALVAPYKGRLVVLWENGHTAVVDASALNIYHV